MEENIKRILEQYSNTVPVPVVAIAGELGAEVYESSILPDSKSGSICKKECGGFEIVVNANHSTNRKRFTIAHEIAHIILHSDILEKIKTFEDFSKRPVMLNRENGSNNSSTKIEKDADKLAGEILMPDKIFKNVWGTSNSVEEVADYFQVSQSAANMRAGMLFKQSIY